MAYPRVTTGSLGFDIGLGGGIPIGTCSMFVGGASSMKTTRVLGVIAHAQSLCANCYRIVEIEDVTGEEIEVEVEVESVDDDTGEVTVGTVIKPDMIYSAVATCDCVATGKNLVPMRPWPDERNVKTKSGLAINPETKKSLFDERMERYQENSYEEFVCQYIDVEGTIDLGWAETLGVDIRRLLLSQPTVGEQAADIYEDCIRTGDVDLVALDSIAMMTPLAEAEEASSANSHVSPLALLINKMCRKLTIAKNDVLAEYGRPITEMWVNQYRVKPMAFGDPRTLPGGNGQIFYPSIRVEVRLSDFEKGKLDLGNDKDSQETADAARNHFKILKNKTYRQAQGSFRVFLVGEQAGSADNLNLVERLGREMEEIWKDGSKWYCLDEEFRTKSDLLSWLHETPLRAAELQARIMRKLERQI